MKLRCPGCRDTFSWNTKKGWPKFCPLCGYSTSMDGKPEVASPLIGNPKHKSGDNVYRAYEEATAEHARMAAEITGDSVADMSGLKVTDFNTQQRQGDLSVKPVSNDVSTFMAQNPKAMANIQSNAIGFAAAAHTGKNPHAGANAFSALRDIHAKFGAASVMASQIVPKGQKPSAQPMISSAPTKEVLDRTVRQGGKVTF